VILSRCMRMSDSQRFAVSPWPTSTGPRASRSGDVADLGHEDGGEDLSDPIARYFKAF
jgi:hypothetical protein